MFWIYNSLDLSYKTTEIIIFILQNDNINMSSLENNLRLFEDNFGKISLGVVSDISEIEHFKESFRVIIIDFQNNIMLHTKNSSKEFQNNISISNKYKHAVNDQLIHSNIGYHRNIAKSKDLQNNEELELNSFSLGELNENLIHCEPVLRNASQLFIELNCLKLSETLDNEISLPTGLTIEQLCKIVRFACCSENLSRVNFKINDFSSKNTNSFTVAAIVIWYLCEALEDYQELKIYDKEITEYLVDHLTFSHDKITDQWSVRMFDSSNTIPCIQSDYHSVLNGELPLRISRLVNNLTKEKDS